MLFSEPKIPQFEQREAQERARAEVSVLFSEPKIPQFGGDPDYYDPILGFSALQRAENSSIVRVRATVAALATVSVLFSEPKIPQ